MELPRRALWDLCKLVEQQSALRAFLIVRLHSTSLSCSPTWFLSASSPQTEWDTRNRFHDDLSKSYMLHSLIIVIIKYARLPLLRVGFVSDSGESEIDKQMIRRTTKLSSFVMLCHVCIASKVKWGVSLVWLWHSIKVRRLKMCHIAKVLFAFVRQDKGRSFLWQQKNWCRVNCHAAGEIFRVVDFRRKNFWLRGGFKGRRHF